MGESFDIIMRLLTETEPITYESDWFTLNEARLHLQPVYEAAFPRGGRRGYVAVGHGARRAARRMGALHRRPDGL